METPQKEEERTAERVLSEKKGLEIGKRDEETGETAEATALFSIFFSLLLEFFFLFFY